MTNENATPSMVSPEAYDAEVLANAVRFTASLFLGRGKYANAEGTTREEIETYAEVLSAEHPKVKSKPIITAFDAAGNQTVISGAAYKAPKAPKAAKPAKAKAEKAKKEPKAKAEKPAKEAKEKGPRMHAKTREALENAEKGILPTAPDMHKWKPYQRRVDEVSALIEKGDIKGLTAYEIKPYDSGMQAIARFRDMAITALKAQKKAAKAAAAETAEQPSPEASE